MLSWCKQKIECQTMHSNSTQLCRVCLQNSDDSVNIFDKFRDSTIASILVEHFWFQVHKNDGLTEWLCQICWIQIKTFQIFYNRIKFLRADCYNSVSDDSVSADVAAKERCVSPKKEVLEVDMNIVKCEEPTLSEVVYPLTEENSCDLDDNYANDDESENSQTSEDEDQTSNRTPANDSVVDICHAENKTHKAKIKSKSWNVIRLEEQDAAIREVFNMKCEICTDFEFESLRKCKQHYRKVHNTMGYITCCGKKFYVRREIRIHVQRHVNPEAYRCDQCGKHCISKRSLKTHMGNHNSPVHKCSLCSKSFVTAYRLKAHTENTHYSKTGELIPCKKCGKKFKSKILLNSHIRFVHNTTHDHICEICALKFKTKAVLNTHISRIHPTAPLPKVQCNICGAKLKHEYGLRGHMKLHSRREDDFLNCPICKKVVKGNEALRNHMRFVHGKRKHQCVQCEKAFHSVKTLKEHVASHTGEDLYNCLFCEKKFKSNANLSSHRRKAHMAEWTDYLEKKKEMEQN